MNILYFSNKSFSKVLHKQNNNETIYTRNSVCKAKVTKYEATGSDFDF